MQKKYKTLSMKSNRMYIGIVLLFLFGCAKEKTTEVPAPNNFFSECTVNFNGVNRSATDCSSSINPYYNKLRINIKLSENESLGILNFENNIGEIQRIPGNNPNLSERLSVYYSKVDLDVICDVYNLNSPDSLQNWIQVTQYDSITKEIWGKFSANLKIQQYPSSCDT